MVQLYKKWFSASLGTPRQHFHATNPINPNLPKMTQNDPLTKNALLPYNRMVWLPRLRNKKKKIFGNPIGNEDGIKILTWPCEFAITTISGGPSEFSFGIVGGCFRQQTKVYPERLVQQQSQIVNKPLLKPQIIIHLVNFWRISQFHLVDEGLKHGSICWV